MVSIKVLVMLFGICVLATKTYAAKHACCTNHTKGRLPFAVITRYSEQIANQLCPLNAIIFHTKKGKEVCADPILNWVILYVNRLRKKALRVHMTTAQPPQ